MLVGGGPVPKPLLERCAAQAVPVVQTYGLTETASQVATLRPADALRRLGSAGQALPGAEIRIVGAADAMVGAGEAGEIAVRGPMVTAGYWQRPAETARALRDGWLHTGDLGYLDAEGYLYVLDRRDDLIVSGGENVYPAEVEAVLLAQPAVREAAVVGMPDRALGPGARRRGRAARRSHARRGRAAYRLRGRAGTLQGPRPRLVRPVAPAHRRRQTAPGSGS